jgi:hypothetical protein
MQSQGKRRKEQCFDKPNRTQNREVYKMKEHEQKVIEAMLAAVSELNEFEMGYFLGYAEAKAQEAERKKQDKPADEEKREEV